MKGKVALPPLPHMDKKLAIKIKRLNKKLLKRTPKPFIISGEPEERAQKLSTCKIICNHINDWLQENPSFSMCRFLKTEENHTILYVYVYDELDFMMVALLEREAKPLPVQFVLGEGY